MGDGADTMMVDLVVGLSKEQCAVRFMVLLIYSTPLTPRITQKHRMNNRQENIVMVMYDSLKEGLVPKMGMIVYAAAMLV